MFVKIFIAWSLQAVGKTDTTIRSDLYTGHETAQQRHYNWHTIVVEIRYKATIYGLYSYG